MIGIVLFSHGSVRCGAGGALRAHAERLRRNHSFPLVEVGYLNYSEPLFAEAVERLAFAGASKIVVVPFFLAPGYFVSHGLPQCVELAQEAHPGIDFLIAPPLGADERIAEAVLASAGAAKTNAADLAALLVMVHGSPKAEANDEMYRVVEMVRTREALPIVEVGFMECNRPTIPEAIETCLRQGARQIVAVPYFLHMGEHVAEDLPALLEEARVQHPDTEFFMGEYIGNSEKLTSLLAERACEALKA